MYQEFLKTYRKIPAKELHPCRLGVKGNGPRSDGDELGGTPVANGNTAHGVPTLLNQVARLLETRAHHEIHKVLLLPLPQGQYLPESARANEQKTRWNDPGS